MWANRICGTAYWFLVLLEAGLITVVKVKVTSHEVELSASTPLP